MNLSFSFFWWRYFSQSDLLERVPKVFIILGATYAALQIFGCLLICDCKNVSNLNSQTNLINDSFDENLDRSKESKKCNVNSNINLIKNDNDEEINTIGVR